ncbi:hypothetical protein ACF06Q_08490 [Streptomyces leeuwenhoekii]|uniref:hypothetical protein n=1 Tax=Streptomyces leeuwenhoekii TaxID=1437453 RepID=UPI0036F6B576
MPLHAEQFFTCQLQLTDGTVIGDSYYSTPAPGSPLRLRIDFTRTIRVGEYDGLRLQTLHTEQGVLDTAILTFAAHDTFHSRDAALGRKPGDDGHAVIRDWNVGDEPPWQGAATTKLRRAIEQYTTLWFPQAAKRQPKAPEERPTLTGRPAAEPNGFWLTDPDFRSRLEAATRGVLDVVADCLDDDFRLLQALDGVRCLGDLLGIPDEFGALVEAKAAVEIVGGDTGSPFDPAVAQALVLLDQRPVEDQERAVRTALRRTTSTTRSHAPTAPTRPAPPPPSAGRTR